MRAAVISICLLWLQVMPASAETFRNCTPQEARIVAQALDTAKLLTIKAASVVGDTREYARWFGDYSQEHAEEVRAALKGIVAAIRRGGVTVQCDQIEPNGCESGEYAFVFSNRPYHMHLCPAFFRLPALEALQPGSRGSEFGTREGTIVHELSHFETVAGTEDHCYSRRECRQMARSDPDLAIDNADSYQYFTEDVSFFARQPLRSKPDPAASANR